MAFKRRLYKLLASLWTWFSSVGCSPFQLSASAYRWFLCWKSSRSGCRSSLCCTWHCESRWAPKASFWSWQLLLAVNCFGGRRSSFASVCSKSLDRRWDNHSLFGLVGRLSWSLDRRPWRHRLRTFVLKSSGRWVSTRVRSWLVFIVRRNFDC